MQGTQIRDLENETGVVPGLTPLLPAPVPHWPPAVSRTPRFAGLFAAISSAIATRRIFVLLPFAMILGMMIYAQLPFEPEPLALAGVAAGLAVLAPVLWHSPMLRTLGLAMALWGGLCLLPLHGATFGTAMLERPAYGMFEARVDEIISVTADGQRVVLSSLVPTMGDRPVDIRKARIVAPAQPLLAPGDTVAGMMRLVPVPGPILPGAYDGQFHSYFSGIGAYGTITSDFSLVTPGQGFDLNRLIERARAGIGQRIDAVLDGSSAAIGRAMVMGDQSAITDETRDLMAASGLAHIYSISGLHLSIVAGGVFWLVRLALAAIPGAATRMPVKKIGASCGLVAA
ncbi:MAG: ComEC family competence protein, partial [Devosia sp.]|nr:ComEC family competence protein [Devosia sp.]